MTPEQKEEKITWEDGDSKNFKSWSEHSLRTEYIEINKISQNPGFFIRNSQSLIFMIRYRIELRSQSR